MADVLCVGNALIDAFLTIHDVNTYCRVNAQENELCMKYGEKIPLAASEFLLGGNACNVSVGLSRLGFQSGLCAEVGSDEFANKIISGLIDNKVNTVFVRHSEGQSSFAIGLNFNSERTLFVRHFERKHNFSLTGYEANWIYLTSLGKEWKSAYANTLAFIKEQGIKLAFNPGTPQMEEGVNSFADILVACDILFVNKQEGERLVEKENLDVKVLLVELKKLGSDIVVMTDGKNGSYVINQQGKTFSMDIAHCPVVERTGAGDAYATGFLGAIMEEKDIPAAMQWGTLNSASVIGKIGAQPGLLRREEMEEQVGQHTELVIKEI